MRLHDTALPHHHASHGWRISSNPLVQSMIGHSMVPVSEATVHPGCWQYRKAAWQRSKSSVPNIRKSTGRTK